MHCCSASGCVPSWVSLPGGARESVAGWLCCMCDFRIGLIPTPFVCLYRIHVSLEDVVANGAGLQLVNVGTAVVDGCSFERCVAFAGGAIYALGGESLRISRTTFDDVVGGFQGAVASVFGPLQNFFFFFFLVAIGARLVSWWE